MKFLTFIIIIGLNTSLFFQSTYKELSVPRVQEAPQIDSLIQKGLSNVIPNKSCILLDIRTTGKLCVAFYSISKTDPHLIDLGIKKVKNRWTLNYTDNLRFFEYNGYVVFVCGESDSFNFFSLKKSSRNFRFSNTYTEKDERNPALNMIYLHVEKYENGKFIPLNEGGPDLK